MGNTSVTVITDTKRKSRAIIYCENALYTLEYTRSRPNEAATVQRVWITDQAVSALQHGNLSEITQAVNSWLPEGNSGFGEGLFFCIDGNTLHTVSLGSGLKSQTIPQMIPQRLKVYGSPTRLIYSNQLQKLIVLQNKTTILRNRYINGAHNVPGKRSLRPQILFLDPANQTSTESDPDLTDIDDGKNPEHNHTLMESECKPGEKFLGITEWFPKVNGNEYHMLVINTVMSRAKKPTGRLLILAIQGGRSEQPKLAVKKRIELEGPVYSVATYPEKSLVYCCGNYLYLQSLGATDSSGVKWQSPTKLEMRSPGWHITVKAPYIYVSSTRESLSVYRYEAGQLIYQFGDQSARNGVHHINIPSQSLVLASDMSNTVVGLWQPPTRRIDNAMPTVFEAVFSTTITRMTTLTRPTWARSTYNAAAGTDPLQASVLGDEVVLGSSADGTLIQFDVISTGWRLLRLIQNMAQRSPVVCPFMGLQAFKHPVEPPTAKPHHLHIDGDILQRVVERGGAELLKEMLDVEPDAESHTDFESKEARWERCRELAGEVVDVGDREWLGRVIEWVRYQLRSAL